MSFFRLFKQKRNAAADRKKALRQVMYGCALANNKQDDDAISLFQQAVDADSLCAEAHYALGLMYAKKGMNNEALAEYNKAIDINPEYKTRIANLGVVQENDNFDVIKELKKYL